MGSGQLAFLEFFWNLITFSESAAASTFRQRTVVRHASGREGERAREREREHKSHEMKTESNELTGTEWREDNTDVQWRCTCRASEQLSDSLERKSTQSGFFYFCNIRQKKCRHAEAPDLQTWLNNIRTSRASAVSPEPVTWSQSRLSSVRPHRWAFVSQQNRNY